ncbi:zinc finger protein 62-like [Phlebotomus argentipes]|uniref:zinc finger protein 62-like n=1 Tax=Phlebotomus argentipes TaxID=94469 RepID=UPI002892D715|nr:zinc finger protein 62-like [Phlebotomus argentipes]
MDIKQEMEEAFDYADHCSQEIENQFINSDIVTEEYRVQDVLVPVIKKEEESSSIAAVKKEVISFETKEHRAYPDTHFNSQRLKKRKNTRKKLFTCDKCGKLFQSGDGFWSHKKTAHNSNPQILSCIYCSKTYLKFTGLIAHMKARHRGLPRKTGAIPTCSFCKLVCKSIEDLQEHVEEMHPLQNRFECALCDWSTYYKYLIIRHMKVNHMKQKYEACRFCAKICLKKRIYCHISAKHREHKALQCEICSKTFKTKRTLKNHKQTHFVPDKEDYVKCLYCTKSFYRLRNLREHARVFHRGLSARPQGPPFKCTVCKRNHDTLDQLINHAGVHKR